MADLQIWWAKLVLRLRKSFPETKYNNQKETDNYRDEITAEMNN
jgi:hypothetical protein